MAEGEQQQPQQAEETLWETAEGDPIVDENGYLIRCIRCPCSPLYSCNIKLRTSKDILHIYGPPGYLDISITYSVDISAWSEAEIAEIEDTHPTYEDVFDSGIFSWFSNIDWRPWSSYESLWNTDYWHRGEHSSLNICYAYDGEHDDSKERSGRGIPGAGICSVRPLTFNIVDGIEDEDIHVYWHTTPVAALYIPAIKANLGEKLESKEWKSLWNIKREIKRTGTEITMVYTAAALIEVAANYMPKKFIDIYGPNGSLCYYSFRNSIDLEPPMVMYIGALFGKSVPVSSAAYSFLKFNTNIPEERWRSLTVREAFGYLAAKEDTKWWLNYPYCFCFDGLEPTDEELYNYGIGLTRDKEYQISRGIRLSCDLVGQEVIQKEAIPFEIEIDADAKLTRLTKENTRVFLGFEEDVKKRTFTDITTTTGVATQVKENGMKDGSIRWWVEIDSVNAERIKGRLLVEQPGTFTLNVEIDPRATAKGADDYEQWQASYDSINYINRLAPTGWPYVLGTFTAVAEDFHFSVDMPNTINLLCPTYLEIDVDASHALLGTYLDIYGIRDSYNRDERLAAAFRNRINYRVDGHFDASNIDDHNLTHLFRNTIDGRYDWLVPGAWTVDDYVPIRKIPATIDECLELNKAYTGHMHVDLLPVLAYICEYLPGFTVRFWDVENPESNVHVLGIITNVTASGSIVVSPSQGLTEDDDFYVATRVRLPCNDSIATIRNFPHELYREGSDGLSLVGHGTREYIGEAPDTFARDHFDKVPAGRYRYILKDVCNEEEIASQPIRIGEAPEQEIRMIVSSPLELHVYGPSAQLTVSLTGTHGLSVGNGDLTISGLEDFVDAQGNPISVSDPSKWNGGTFSTTIMALETATAGVHQLQFSATARESSVEQTKELTVVDTMEGQITISTRDGRNVVYPGVPFNITWTLTDSGGYSLIRFETGNAEQFQLPMPSGITLGSVTSSQTSHNNWTATATASACGTFTFSASNPQRAKALGTTSIEVQARHPEVSCSLTSDYFHTFGGSNTLDLLVKIYKKCDGTMTFSGADANLYLTGSYSLDSLFETALGNALLGYITNASNWDVIESTDTYIEYELTVGVRAKACLSFGEDTTYSDYMYFTYDGTSCYENVLIDTEITADIGISGNTCPDPSLAVPVSVVFSAGGGEASLPRLTESRQYWGFTYSHSAGASISPVQSSVTSDDLTIYSTDSGVLTASVSLNCPPGTILDTVTKALDQSYVVTVEFSNSSLHSCTNSTSRLTITLRRMCSTGDTLDERPTVSLDNGGLELANGSAINFSTGWSTTNDDTVVWSEDVRAQAGLASDSSVTCTASYSYSGLGDNGALVNKTTSASAMVHLLTGVTATLQLAKHRAAPNEEVEFTVRIYGDGTTEPAVRCQPPDFSLYLTNTKTHMEASFVYSSMNTLSDWNDGVFTGELAIDQTGSYIVSLEDDYQVYDDDDIVILNAPSSLILEGPNRLHVLGRSETVKVYIYINGEEVDSGSPAISLITTEADNPEVVVDAFNIINAISENGVYTATIEAKKEAEPAVYTLYASYTDPNTSEILTGAINITVYDELLCSITATPHEVELGQNFIVSATAKTPWNEELTRAAGEVQITHRWKTAPEDDKIAAGSVTVLYPTVVKFGTAVTSNEGIAGYSGDDIKFDSIPEEVSASIYRFTMTSLFPLTGTIETDVWIIDPDDCDRWRIALIEALNERIYAKNGTQNSIAYNTTSSGLSSRLSQHLAGYTWISQTDFSDYSINSTGDNSRRYKIYRSQSGDYFEEDPAVNITADVNENECEWLLQAYKAVCKVDTLVLNRNNNYINQTRAPWTSIDEAMWDKQRLSKTVRINVNDNVERYKPEEGVNWDIMLHDALGRMGSPSWEDSASGDWICYATLHRDSAGSWRTWYIETILHGERRRFHLGALPPVPTTVIYFRCSSDVGNAGYGNKQFNKLGTSIPDEGTGVRLSFLQGSSGTLERSAWSCSGTPSMPSMSWDDALTKGFNVWIGLKILKFHFRHS